MQLIRLIGLVRQLAGVLDAATIRRVIALVQARDWIGLAELLVKLFLQQPGSIRVAADPGHAAAAADLAAACDAAEAELTAAAP